MDYLVQRWLSSTANEAHKNSGTWEDVGIVRNLKVDQEQLAATTVMKGVPPLLDSLPNRIRVVKWEHVTEFDAAPGTYELSSQTKTTRP